MPSKLRPFPVALVGGLHDSQARGRPSDFQQLTNVVAYRGRLALRAPLEETCNLVDDQVTPANITQVLAIEYHEGKMYVVGHSSVTTDTYLYRLETTGAAESGDPEFPNASPLPQGSPVPIWTGANVPVPIMVSFEGGSATAGVSRVYICDYSEQYDTRYWDSDGLSFSTVTEDFDDDGSKENLRFGFLFAYASHLFGTGFYQNGASRRPELLRISQPGLIPADEPGVTNNPSREWWFSDFREVGVRGEAIVAAVVVDGGAFIFKRHRGYFLSGYDLSSFRLKNIDEKLGSLGPKSAAALPGGRCLVWTSKGPHLGNRTGLVDIGEQIRKRVNEVGYSEDILVEYSPHDGLVYCVVTTAGQSAPGTRYAFDLQNERWVNEGSWIPTGGGTLLVNDLAAIPDETLPGPTAAPSSLTATTVDDDTIDLEWVNGDTAIDTITKIHRGTSPGFAVNDGNEIDTVTSGTTTYRDDDVAKTSDTTYYYKVRHTRNNTNSANSNEANADTALDEPTNLKALSFATGVQVKVTNNFDTADIDIERKPAGGSWTALTTLAAQSLGEKTHNDTTATCGIEYSYRAKASKAGSQDSVYSNEASKVACLSAPTLTSAAHGATLTSECPSTPNVLVTWIGTNLKPSDTVQILRNDNGAGFTEDRGTVPAQNGTFRDTWGRKSGATGRTLEYRVKLFDGGTDEVDSADTTQSAESVDAGICPEP